jgi:hypothetical protein
MAGSAKADETYSKNAFVQGRRRPPWRLQEFLQNALKKLPETAFTTPSRLPFPRSDFCVGRHAIVQEPGQSQVFEMTPW